jgi:two-component system cell cycle response regulator
MTGMHIGSRRGRDATDVLLRRLAAREPAVREHVREVAGMARAVAWLLGMSGTQRDVVASAAELHDIGKMEMPEEILTRRGPLRPEEQDQMRRHTLIGASRSRRPVAVLVRASHERWDGRGYPDGLHGEAIPLGARIVAVCDAFCAMCEERPYGHVLSEAEAMAELRRCSGTQFDPTVVRAFCAARRTSPASF